MMENIYFKSTNIEETILNIHNKVFEIFPKLNLSIIVIIIIFIDKFILLMKKILNPNSPNLTNYSNLEIILM